MDLYIIFYTFFVISVIQSLWNFTATLFVNHINIKQVRWGRFSEPIFSMIKPGINLPLWQGIEPGPRRGQTVRYIYPPTELSWLLWLLLPYKQTTLAIKNGELNSFRLACKHLSKYLIWRFVTSTSSSPWSMLVSPDKRTPNASHRFHLEILY